jgi:hypothetical protein
MSFLKTISKWFRNLCGFLEQPLVIDHDHAKVRRAIEDWKHPIEEVAFTSYTSGAGYVVVNPEDDQSSRNGRIALLMRYNLSRMKLMETGGFLDIDTESLARFLGLELGPPKPLRDKVYAEFGALADSADRMLTGDLYEEGNGD